MVDEDACHWTLIAVGEHGNADTALRQNAHQRPPTNPAAVVENGMRLSIFLERKTKAIMHVAKLRGFGAADVNPWRQHLVEYGGGNQLSFIKPAPIQQEFQPVGH